MTNANITTLKPDLDPARPLPTDWDDYVAWLMPRWLRLLSTDPAEQEVQRFLEAHPSLLTGAHGYSRPGSYHGILSQVVFREPPLQGLNRNRRPDFMWITRTTSSLSPIFVEIERPGKRWFTEKEVPTAELTQALDQFTDWKVWLSEPSNQLIFRETYLSEEDWGDRRFAPQFLLIYGRNAEFGTSGSTDGTPSRIRKKRDFMRRPDEHFMTFDALRPRVDDKDLITVTSTARGLRIERVPPSFTTGPLTMDLASLGGDIERVVEATDLWSKDRKRYVGKRFNYWKTTARTTPASLRLHTLQTGE